MLRLLCFSFLCMPGVPKPETLSPKPVHHEGPSVRLRQGLPGNTSVVSLAMFVSWIQDLAHLFHSALVDLLSTCHEGYLPGKHRLKRSLSLRCFPKPW